LRQTSCGKQPALGLWDGEPKFPGRFQPFRDRGLDVAKSLLGRGAVGSAARQFRDFGEEGSGG
jgi:hypothetical protein